MYRLAVATQSVSMAGYQKHMQNHIDVVLHLAKYLSLYMKKQQKPDGKCRTYCIYAYQNCPDGQRSGEYFYEFSSGRNQREIYRI